MTSTLPFPHVMSESDAEGVRPSVPWSTFTRLVVMCSLVGAAWVGSYRIGSDAYWPAIVIAAAITATTFWSLRVALGVVLGTAFTAPALLQLALGHFYWPQALVWLMALTAIVVVPDWRGPWAIPRPAVWPLVLWALTAALVWPVVVMREANFSFTLLRTDPRFLGTVLWSSSWIVQVAITHLLGILWFDWLYRRFDGKRGEFEQIVLLPLTVSWLISVAFGAYQALVDIGFANGGAHLGLHRSSGGLMDANPFGLISAVGGPVLLGRWLRRDDRSGLLIWGAGLALSWYGMWVSGSRGAFGASVMMLGFVLYGVLTSTTRRARTHAIMALAGFSAVVVAIVAAAPPLNSPIARFASTFHGLTTTPLPRFLIDRWDMYHYGATASAMFADSPIFGVGVGSFNMLVSMYSKMLGLVTLPPDNAQNWFRHQFVEFGIAGSIGLLWWTIWMGHRLFRSPRNPSDRQLALTLKGALLTIAIVSLMGMPAQNAAVVIMFWTFAYYFLALTAPESVERREPAAVPWLVMLAIAGACAAGTAYVGWTLLNPPMRLAWTGDAYSAGMTLLDKDQSGREFRRTGPYGFAVVIPSTRWMSVTFQTDPAGTQRGPIHVTARFDRKLLIDTRLPDARPVTEYVTLKDPRKAFVIEVSVFDEHGNKRQSSATSPQVLIAWKSVPLSFAY